jgi:hypothetical protein
MDKTTEEILKERLNADFLLSRDVKDKILLKFSELENDKKQKENFIIKLDSFLNYINKIEEEIFSEVKRNFNQKIIEENTMFMQEVDSIFEE